MNDALPQPNVNVGRILRQQAALAAFGGFALRETDLQKILTEAARICADSLSTPFCKICRYRSTENDLVIVAGCGWQPNVIGQVIPRADESTPQGRAYITNKAVIIRNVHESTDLSLPDFFAQHGIISTINVVIRSREGPAYGVLGVDSPNETDFDQNDVNFLTGFANVLAEAVATQTRVETLKMFARELEHRVRNNLQYIVAMLDILSQKVVDDESKKGIETISLRLMTMTEMYDHLLGANVGTTIEFSAYVTTLCASLSDVYGSKTGDVELVYTGEPTPADLDTATAMGLVVAELVTNSYQHAFSDGRPGTITVALSGSAAAGNATLTIKDNGVGFATEASSGRHGLGLVESLVESVSGTSIVESDHGTTWTMTFPTQVKP